MSKEVVRLRDKFQDTSSKIGATIAATSSTTPPTCGSMPAMRNSAAPKPSSEGVVSIATEVAWTKYLSIFTGATVYGFAAILGLFLTGIAAGSALSSRLVPEGTPPPRWIAVGTLVLAATLLLTRAGLSLAPLRARGVGPLRVARALPRNQTRPLLGHTVHGLLPLKDRNRVTVRTLRRQSAQIKL